MFSGLLYCSMRFGSSCLLRIGPVYMIKQAVSLKKIIGYGLRFRVEDQGCDKESRDSTRTDMGKWLELAADKEK